MADLQDVCRYHDGTKHHFGRFARSLGFLDWASQPAPFRSFPDVDTIPLYPAPSAGGTPPPPLAFDDLYRPGALAPLPLDAVAIGDILRHSLGLSAWKAFGGSRWSLRVNPSSGNLHPTEAYVVCGATEGISGSPGVFHYAPDRHVLERRCAFDAAAWCDASDNRPVVLLVLSSIHWREAWKYGERAFRYCQHDLGHAIAALGFAAALVGWHLRLLPEWSHDEVSALAGLDRGQDFMEAEPEEPGCALALTRDGQIGDGFRGRRKPLVDAVRRGRWSGRASQLSEDHVQWTFIDEVVRATRDPGRPAVPADEDEVGARLPISADEDEDEDEVGAARPARQARTLMLQRRSAVAFDKESVLDVRRFSAMLARLMPGRHAPWSTLWWTPRIHLALFVHRVEGVAPGLYFAARSDSALERVRGAMTHQFEWSRVDDGPLFCLRRGDVRALASRVSCGQDIAADGFFSVAMIAEFESGLLEHGPSFYRQLFWESGVVGQVLYLEAEAAGARGTGIGCFFDDPVHEVLGLRGHAFQSLYHFAAGMPVDDRRLTTSSGYTWG